MEAKQALWDYQQQEATITTITAEGDSKSYTAGAPD